MAEKSKVETLAELKRQQNELNARIEAERGAALAEIVAKAKADAEAVGVSVDELIVAIRKAGRGAGRVAGSPAKYVNPENPKETWTGHGRRPKWVTAAMMLDPKLESLAVGQPKAS